MNIFSSLFGLTVNYILRKTTCFIIFIIVEILPAKVSMSNSNQICFTLEPGDSHSFGSSVAIIEANFFKLVSEVRAFDVGSANLSILNLIDSDGNAQLLSSAGNLFDAFDTSLDKNTIDRIEVKKAGQLIQTIAPD